MMQRLRGLMQVAAIIADQLLNRVRPFVYGLAVLLHVLQLNVDLPAVDVLDREVEFHHRSSGRLDMNVNRGRIGSVSVHIGRIPFGQPLG